MKPPTFEPLQKNLLYIDQEEYCEINAACLSPSKEDPGTAGMIPRWVLLYHILNSSSNRLNVKEAEPGPCACESIDLEKVIE